MSLAAQLTSTDEEIATEAMQIDDETSMASETEALGSAETAFQEKVLSTICDEYIYHSRTEVSFTPKVKCPKPTHTSFRSLSWHTSRSCTLKLFLVLLWVYEAKGITNIISCSGPICSLHLACVLSHLQQQLPGSETAAQRHPRGFRQFAGRLG